MSYTSELKSELSRINTENKCCMLADISGFLRVAGSVRFAGSEKFTIVASTENPAVARYYKKLIKKYFNSNASIEVGSSQAPGKSATAYRYYITVKLDEKSMQILRETGLLLTKGGNDYLSDGIYMPIVKSKCCRRAYIRGLFLGCGTMSDPRRSNHMEFITDSTNVAQDLKELIGTFTDLSASVAERKGKNIVYIKKADYISDMLGIMGASKAMLEFENIRIGKGLRVEVQRISNCDNANIDRSLSASEQQIRQIRLIEEKLGLENIDPKLCAVAKLRLKHPEASLAEIGAALDPEVKKPAVSKRFAKISDIAEGLIE